MNSPAHYSLLVVDDEPDLRTLYELTLLREGYDVESASSVDDAWQRLSSRTYSAVITDMRLPDGSGLDLLRRLEQAKRREKAIVITAYGSAEGAVEALKAGAFDYLTKPVDLRQFRGVVASALGRTPSTPAGRDASAGAPARTGDDAGTDPGRMHPALSRLAGRSQAMQQVRSMVERVARSMAPVLVQGESGTGKELVARAIHACSARSDAPFIAVNCGAIPEQLLEAEFFGYRKGSFTGAHEDREGFVQAAQGGTLFLDEIGDLPLAMQSKLLRVIQERTVRPVGAVTETPINVRVVSATHRDLASEVHEGRFRQDLYYRLNVIQIRVPALRERIDDLPAICDLVLARIAGEAGISPPPRLSAQAMERLSDYAFPGNVRELENLLHRALALSTGEAIEWADLGLPDDVFVDSGIVDLDALHAASEAARKVVAAAPAGELPTDLVAYLDQVERDILIRALEQHRFNRTAAGAGLGLSLRQMRYRMARLGVNVADHVGERGDSAF
ncbi:MAG: sigma-54-dependent Fis family transcriptional regulator [Burkholderiaceae bacterium]|nr:MAG: sigma-54-dependent Fis family transcriptional regulator [Burkholderiaceae bacterium]MBE7426094.1 sigma-54-dependent Fis family transcriptional regulator [Ideonella sp.]MCC7287702.1 sigma-54-dependent Fis family transcriptional regulator [Burkholderiaceae bacterium]